MCECACYLVDGFPLADCEHCMKNYETSTVWYMARAYGKSTVLVGYLVKSKETHKVLGIRSITSGYREVERININTLVEYTEQGYIKMNLLNAEFTNIGAYVGMLTEDSVLDRSILKHIMDVSFEAGWNSRGYFEYV